MQHIHIRGARTHNLKNLTVTIPRNQLVVITGLSGSGKSSLAFDTLYAEGQRRYVESLSAYARQFLSMMEKPDVDHIEGLSPAISIEQKTTSHNPRSTVGTITEIYDYLRVLFARAGEARCPTHGQPLHAQTISQMVDQVLALPKDSRLMMLAPLIKERKGEHVQLLEKLRAQGYVRVRINGELIELDEIPTLALRKKHTIEVVVDRFKVRPDIALRLAESFEAALKLSQGIVTIETLESSDSDTSATAKEIFIFSAKFSCPLCGYSIAELEPRLFSFNNPVGACSECDGLGVSQFVDPTRVIRDLSLSLANGAIRGWEPKNRYTWPLIEALSQEYAFDLHIPFADLPKNIQTILLDGEPNVPNLDSDVHKTHKPKRYRFEGILANIARRYRETESGLIRDELAKLFATKPCPDCNGTRLCEAARHVFVADFNLPNITHLAINKALDFFTTLQLTGQRAQIIAKLKKEIIDRLQFLIDVGLNYLSLDRSAETLSGGEAQRIRLASQIGSGLVGVMYILDEPSIGLHQRDNARLLTTLRRLRDLGNTIIMVEHDDDAIQSADHIIDMGPGAGVHGGHLVAQGKVADIIKVANSLTGDYLAGRKTIPIPEQRTAIDETRVLQLLGATGHNLKKVDLTIPAGLFTCITGVSGSGKSTLINDTLYPLCANALNRAQLPVAAHQEIQGLSHFDKVIDIDQSPIGRTPRSNPATYSGVLTDIRDLFAGTQEARSRGYLPGRFSFNVKGGRCEACEGDGVTKVAMHFLADVYVTCDVCQGKRYNRETLDITYKGKNIHEVLSMTIEEAVVFFDKVPSLFRKLTTLGDVGLNYVQLGQSATTLSGGEAQRLKLAKELAKRDTGRTLYILDEPTTGLHFHDIAQLLLVLTALKGRGNTIVVIEHNLDVIKTADWIVDLGPEGGEGGGQILATGTPETIAATPHSYTGQFLKAMGLNNRNYA